MSPRSIVLAAALLAAAVTAWLLFKTGTTPAAAPLPAPVERPIPPAPPAETPPPIAATPPRPVAIPAAPPSSTSDAVPASDLARIENAVTSGQPSALPLVAPYLTHADPALREAARDAMLQMGLAESVPLLREAAGKLKDPREAILLLDAADFLSLPSIPVTGDGKPRKAGATPPPQQPQNSRPAGKSTSALGH